MFETTLRESSDKQKEYSENKAARPSHGEKPLWWLLRHGSLKKTTSPDVSSE
jgi:hypothetical protein